MSCVSDDKYPIERSRYFQSVGRLLVHRLGQILEELGYTNENGYRIRVIMDQRNGVDLRLWHYGVLVLAAEIANWSIRSKIAERRKRSIIHNLTECNCSRVFIHTPFENEHLLEDLEQHGVATLNIGFQLQPKHFYDHFRRRNAVEARMIDSRETRAQIKLLIANYLRSMQQERDIQVLPENSMDIIHV
jgi:hypothetical protein